MGVLAHVLGHYLGNRRRHALDTIDDVAPASFGSPRPCPPVRDNPLLFAPGPDRHRGSARQLPCFMKDVQSGTKVKRPSASRYYSPCPNESALLLFCGAPEARLPSARLHF